MIKETDVSLNWYPFGTYDYSIILTYSNIAMGQGGYAIGRSSPLPSTGGSQSTVPCPATFPSGCVPLDAHAGTVIENMIRVQFQIFF